MKNIPGFLVVISASLILAGSCEEIENDDPSRGPDQTSAILKVGDFYQNGIIVYILQPGDKGYDTNIQHGIIASPVDLSTGIPWDNGLNLSTGATGKAIGQGNINTILIVRTKGAGNYAAKICYDNGWDLPSRDELNILFLNKDIIGGFSDLPYWSSTESGNNYAWHECFSTGYQSNTDMGGIYHVRGVRSF